MKEDRFRAIICSGFCFFYKEGKEELHCGTYSYLRKHFSPASLMENIQDITEGPDFSEDETINNLICKVCSFAVNGCDYRAGVDSPPCGGYLLVEHLIKRGSIDADNMT